MKSNHNWTSNKLQEFASFEGGGTPSRKKTEYFEKGTIPWVKTLDLNNAIISRTEECITELGLKKSSCKILPKGSVLIAMYGGFNQIGRTGLLSMEATVNQAITAIILDRNKLLPRYLLFYLNFNVQKWKKFAVSSRKDPNITKEDIKKMLISFPSSIHEQQKIVEVLETWDKAIQLTRKLIEQKELQKKYLMLQLLTGRTRLKGFTEKWLKLSLSDILKERNTYQTKGAEFPHLSLTKEGVAPKTARYNRDFLVKDENKSYKITLLDDICYNPANLKFGVICRNKYGAGIFSPIYVTYEIKKYDKSFVEKLLLLPTTIALARRYEEGTVYERMAVSSEDFLKLKLDFPPTEEESIEVGKVLMNSDKEIDLLRQKLAKLEEQKKGLMQVLLTGKVRLQVEK